MVLRDHSAEEIRRWVGKFNPDCLLLGLNRIPDWALQAGVSSIFTINCYNQDLSSSSIQHFDIYAITEIGWVGIRPPGGSYIYPGEYFYMEEQSSILILTALGSWLQPFIRYRTLDRSGILGENQFQVTYIGEH
jgi:hypothetical protein